MVHFGGNKNKLYIGRQEMDTFKQSDITLLGESNIHYMLLMLRKLMSPFQTKGVTQIVIAKSKNNYDLKNGHYFEEFSQQLKSTSTTARICIEAQYN